MLSLTVMPLLQSLAIHYIYTIQYCICDPKYTLSTDSRFNEDSNSIIRVRQFLLKTENHAKKKCEKTERAKFFNNILETKVRYSSKMQIMQDFSFKDNCIINNLCVNAIVMNIITEQVYQSAIKDKIECF